MDKNSLRLLRAICVCETAEAHGVCLPPDMIGPACDLLDDMDATLPPELPLTSAAITEICQRIEAALQRADGAVAVAAKAAWDSAAASIRSQSTAAGISLDTPPVISRDPNATTAFAPIFDERAAEGRGAETEPDQYQTGSQRLPQRVERYSRTRFHARGGLGEIHVASDAELNREVALKEMRAQFLSDPGSRARFVMEGEVTGRLEHPGVVPVYGMGLDARGNPFYAMRFIRGESLDAAIRSLHKHSRSTGSVDRLAQHRLLRRFISVCQTLDYAHSRGVLHRDIKPENIMLGNYGESLVVDWGLAKIIGRDKSAATDEAHDVEATLRPDDSRRPNQTIRGSVAGTLLYMSPEQALGWHDRLDPRADVFSLGAVLFELLTGRTLYVADNAADAHRQAIECQPVGVRALAAGVARPLESICLKATCKDPHERYASAGELADDIEAYLADEPTLAHIDSLHERWARWTRKHRTLVSTCAAAGLLIILGLAAFTGLLSTKNREIAHANEQVTQQRDEAQENFRTARSAVRDYLGALAQDERLSESGLDKLRLNLAEAAAPYYTKFLSSLPDDPKLAFEQAELQASLAVISDSAGSRQDTRTYVDNAVVALRKLTTTYPSELLYQVALARSLHRQGMVHATVGDSGPAQAAYQEALQIAESLPVEATRKIVSQLPPSNPFAFSYPVDLQILAHNGLGQLGLDQGLTSDAQGHIAKASELARQRISQDVEAEFNTLVSALQSQATLLKNQGELAQCRTNLSELLEVIDARQVPASQRIRHAIRRIETQVDYGNAWLTSGYPRKALEQFEAAHQQAIALLDEAPENNNVRRTTILTAAARLSPGQAIAIDAAGIDEDNEARLAQLRKSTESLRSVWEASPESLVDSTNFSVALGALAEHYQLMGDPAAARIAIDEALLVTNTLLQKKPNYLPALSHKAMHLMRRADAISRNMELQEAAQNIEESLEITRNSVADAFPGVAVYLEFDAQVRLYQLATDTQQRLKYAQLQLDSISKFPPAIQREPIYAFKRSQAYELVYQAHLQNHDYEQARDALGLALEACQAAQELAPDEPIYPTREMYLHLLTAYSHMQTGILNTVLNETMPDEAMHEFELALTGLENIDLRWIREDLLELCSQATSMVAEYEEQREQYAVAARHFRLSCTILQELHRRTGDRQYELSRAQKLQALYAAEYNAGNHDAAAEALDEEETLLGRLLALDPYDQAARDQRTQMYANRGELHMLNDERQLSAMAYGLAIESADPSRVWELRLYRGLNNARMDRYRLAVEDIELAQQLHPLSGTQAYEAAIVYSLALPNLAQDTSHSEASKQSLAEYYTQNAVRLLRRDWDTSEYGIAESLEFLEEDEELDPLRGREPFEEMMRKIRQEAQP